MHGSVVHFFFLLNSIPLYEYTTVFMQLSVGHLCWFEFLGDREYRAAMNICLQVFV